MRKRAMPVEKPQPEPEVEPETPVMPKEGIPGVFLPEGVTGPVAYEDGSPIYGEDGKPINPRRGGTDPGGFYIHVIDPGFPGYPWPGQRRFGPYATVGEARDQAAHDLANGMYSLDELAGIFSEKNSVACLNGQVEVKSEHDPAKLQAQADEIRSSLLRAAAISLDDTRAALEQLLPVGVSVDDVLRLAGRLK